MTPLILNTALAEKAVGYRGSFVSALVTYLSRVDSEQQRSWCEDSELTLAVSERSTRSESVSATSN
jgi:hypothetical protein